MALNANELYASSSKDPFPRIKSVHQYPKKITAIAAASLLAVGTPMAYDSDNDQWVVWSNGGTVTGADTIRGFLYPIPVQTHASDQVLGMVMVAGEIHYDDIVLPSGETAADLKTAIRANLAARGLYVTGLTQVR
jgi:hypothetical protein